MADRFQTTSWSVVINAAGEGTKAHDALATLCQTYRPPVYAYVLAHVRDDEEAQDLTQAFFAHLLERRLPARADRERGRFRSFLLTALKHFLANERNRARAQRRGGGVRQVPETVIDSLPDTDADPEQAFDREWARTVLREAIRRLETEAVDAGRAELFTQLRGFLIEAPGEGEYESVGERLGMRRNTVAVAVHRLRTRLQELVLEVLGDAAGDPLDLEHELRRMRGALLPPEES